MQRICPRWLHVLMPAEHVRGDKEEPLEKLDRSLAELNGKLDAREEQVDHQMVAMSGQMLRLTEKFSEDVRAALSEHEVKLAGAQGNDRDGFVGD